MPTTIKKGLAERLALQAGTPFSEADTCEQESTSTKPKESMLPLALRDTEITEGDVEVLLRIAQDKNAPSGRYKRVPKKVPAADQK